MENQNFYDANEYLMRFDQILNTMERRMLSGSSTSNITKDFIKAMIPHHEAAILMCQNLLKYPVSPTLTEIAQNIIKTQTREIETMRIINRTSSSDQNDSQTALTYYNTYLSITRRMIMRMMESARSIDITLDFVTEMIPHHEGAILMCKNVLMYPINPKLRQLAKEIIEQQSRGVKQLLEIRNQLILR